MKQGKTIVPDIVNFIVVYLVFSEKIMSCMENG
jgi:hypothetical protein